MRSGRGAWTLVAFAPQEGHGLHAVGGHVQAHGLVGVAEGFLRQPDIAGTVFDQEHFYGHVFFLRRPSWLQLASH